TNFFFIGVGGAHRRVPAHVYVAIRQNMAQKAYKQLQNGKIKGKSCRVRLLK
ncbi:hypothetical protein ACLBQW_18840, partial [Klebsiella pneumoniae]